MPASSNSSSNNNNQIAVSRKMWSRPWHRNGDSSPAAAAKKGHQRTSSRTVATDDSKHSSFDEEDDSSSCIATSTKASCTRQQGVPAMVIADQPAVCCSPSSSSAAHSPSSDDAENGQSANETTTASESTSPLDCQNFLKLIRTAEAALNAGELRDGLEFFGQAVEFLVNQQSKRTVDSSSSDDNGDHDDEMMIVTIANLCYTCSRIARRLRDYHAAYQFGALELHHVKNCCSSSEMIVASNHQDLAHICHYELGDSVKALGHYQIAYGLQQLRLQNLRRDVANCPHCISSCKIKALCQEHKALVTEVLSNVQETKECIGRIQFGLGMVADAMTML